jgi:recombination protein RecR
MTNNSRLFEEAVNALSSLPSIGKKSALRLVLHLLKEDKAKTHRISEALSNLVDNIKYCKNCHCISDQEICSICLSPSRDETTICVVENVRDMMAVEDTNQFKGKYHILGGIISPIEGVGPDNLNIQSLIDRVDKGIIQELIMAISPTIEGETTIYYISRQLEQFPVTISTIARGVSFGGELEYADELTLGRSIVSRITYNNTN